MFLVNSRLGLFTAAPLGSSGDPIHPRGRSLSRSYGAILPSSLTRVLSSALGYSPRLPVSVLVRFPVDSLEGISWETFKPLVELNSRTHLRDLSTPDFPGAVPRVSTSRSYRVSLATRSSLLTPNRSSINRKYRNINRLSIVYAFRPRLRCRLTLGGFAFPRKP